MSPCASRFFFQLWENVATSFLQSPTACTRASSFVEFPSAKWRLWPKQDRRFHINWEVAHTTLLSYTVHFIGQECELRTWCLQTLFLPQDHTGDNITAALTETLRQWQLDTSHQTCVTTGSLVMLDHKSKVAAKNSALLTSAATLARVCLYRVGMAVFQKYLGPVQCLDHPAETSLVHGVQWEHVLRQAVSYRIADFPPTLRLAIVFLGHVHHSGESLALWNFRTGSPLSFSCLYNQRVQGRMMVPLVRYQVRGVPTARPNTRVASPTNTNTIVQNLPSVICLKAEMIPDGRHSVLFWHKCQTAWAFARSHRFTIDPL